MRLAVASAVLVGVLAALASNQALAERPKVAVSAEAKVVVEAFVKYAGARSALAYVSAGGRKYTFAAGAGSPRTADDRFRVGSVSETFLAVIVLQLAAEGKLRLDDNLTRYVDRVYGPRDRITLRQLLGHTSGLANYGSFEWWLERANRRNDLRPLDLLKVAELQPRAFTPPGSSFAYSLTDYIALGLVVEKVTGHSVAQELTRRIVRPLRLSQTELPSTRTVSGLHEQGPGINPNLLWAASGIVSTARELSRFFSALLSGRLVPRASLKAMEKTVKDPNGTDRLGLGLLAFDLPCGTYWGRTGTVILPGNARAAAGYTVGTSATVAASADGSRIAVVEASGGAGGVSPPMEALLCR